jgi:16S rRNA (cytosine1402-N4)-methyltransferase
MSQPPPPASDDADEPSQPGAEGVRPPRRQRYAGKHPRRFHEKYKELAAEKYAGDVEKVLKSGKTPAGTHRPIMVAEILDVLRPGPGQTGVDCTLGYGGHAGELLKAIQPEGRLIALDADPIELPKTEARLRALGFPAETLIVRRTNFAALLQVVLTEAPAGVDFLLADLGVSSMQLDDPARGFTYKVDAPLDMRMNPARGLSAAEFLARADAASLTQVLEEGGDEPFAAQLAQGLLDRQRQQPIITTQGLATAINEILTPFVGRDDELVASAIRRAFQAIRIAVNDEYRVLDTLLKTIPQCLKPGGRAAILTFHSGEDRRVKKAFQEGLSAGLYSQISSEVIRAGTQERHDNPRSTSAKLRYAIKAVE